MTPGVSAWVEERDWLLGAPTLPAGSVDLLYADLPFNTGSARTTPVAAAKLGRSAHATYADAWETPGAYVAWLRERLLATLPALAPGASVLLHCDYRVQHHVRLLLDDVLGAHRLVNHLIWSYGLGGSSPRAFARKHDDILFYRLSGEGFFEPPRVEATSRRLQGKTKKATDVLEIASINNMARERTGYPTQKPLALLETLVRACCPPRGMVLDPCCGSGTTLVAAVRCGRFGAGFDVHPVAVRTTRSRLAEANALSDRACERGNG